MADQNAIFKRKHIRLDQETYARTDLVCSVTVAVQSRRPIFANPNLATEAVDMLRTHADKTGVRIYGYCLMPDHVHLVLSPSPTCSIVVFVGQFKNLTLRAAWGHGVKGSFWQKSFWDHFLRAEEKIELAVEYVLNNPVRRGLVDQRKDYPFSGSLVFDL